MIAGVAPERPGVRFLALSVSDAAEDVISVVRAGARGYVTKTISGDELIEAIHRVADGDAVFSPRLAGFVLDAFGSGEPVRDAELDQLTPREREVLRLIARGYRYKEIAAIAAPLGQDGRDARLDRPAQAAALQPPRADALGGRAADDLTRAGADRRPPAANAQSSSSSSWSALTALRTCTTW